MTLPPILEDYVARIGLPASPSVERIFEIIFADDEEIKLAGALPGDAAELASRLGVSVEKAESWAKRLFFRGSIGFKKGKYRFYPAMIELRDAVLLWPEAPQELFDLWERVLQTEMNILTAMMTERKIPPLMRAIPIERTVSAPNAILDADSARKIFEDAELISAIPCVCRLQAKRSGRTSDCRAPETACCLQTNAFAEGMLARGVGERLTREEALRRIDEAEEAGLVHMVRNNIKKDMILCNCCSCCCTSFIFYNKWGYRDAFVPSRFQARGNPELCVACGLCVDRCHFHAITINETAEVDPEKCFGCGACVLTCPQEALIMQEIRPLDYIRNT
ncbi:MAG: 4Fe-4S binding protein [Pseudomonadota bacterium]